MRPDPAPPPARIAYAHAALAAEAAISFIELKRIPSSNLRLICDACLALPDRGVALLQRYASGERALEDWRTLHQLTGAQRGEGLSALGYAPARVIRRQLVAMQRHAKEDKERQYLQSELHRWREVTAPNLRRALKPMLMNEFGAKLNRDGENTWRADLQVADGAWPIEFDFGGAGFRYHLILDWVASAYKPRLNYEELLGFHAAGWDRLQADELDRQLAMLAANLRKTAAVLSNERQLDHDQFTR